MDLTELATIAGDILKTLTRISSPALLVTKLTDLMHRRICSLAELIVHPGAVCLREVYPGML